MAGLMQMPNGQMIVSLHTQHHPTPPDTRRRRVSHLSRTKCPALFLPPRSSVDRRRPSSSFLPFCLTATPDRAPARGHGHEPGQRPAHLQHQRMHGGRGLRPHNPGASQIAPTALKKSPNRRLAHLFAPQIYPHSRSPHVHPSLHRALADWTSSYTMTAAPPPSPTTAPRS